MKRLIYELLLILFIAAPSPLLADAHKILCVYETPPATQEAIYNEVFEGIKNKIGDFEKILVSDNTSSLKQQIDQANPEKIIALGEKAATAVADTPYRDKLIAGLFKFNASSFNGVSLVLTDKAIAAKLTQLIPGIKHIFIIQERGHKTIEKDNGIKSPTMKIVAIDGDDSLSTIRELGRIVEKDATQNDAVFLPSNLPDEILFKVGLMAWDKNIKIFSTNMWHLENGALMAFYPNAKAMGEQLGAMASSNIMAHETVAIIDVGLNRRIAQHLGIQIAPAVEALISVKIK